MRILKSHPLLKMVNSYVIDSPQPSNLSYLWNFGSLLAFCLIIQIVTGVTLAMHYNPSVLEAFNSVEHIMRDVNNGWLLRYLYSNTASAFFFIVYLHIGRGLYYGSYRAPRTLVWTIGTVIFMLAIASSLGFFLYVKGLLDIVYILDCFFLTAYYLFIIIIIFTSTIQIYFLLDWKLIISIIKKIPSNYANNICLRFILFLFGYSIYCINRDLALLLCSYLNFFIPILIILFFTYVTYSKYDGNIEKSIGMMFSLIISWIIVISIININIYLISSIDLISFVKLTIAFETYYCLTMDCFIDETTCLKFVGNNLDLSSYIKIIASFESSYYLNMDPDPFMGHETASLGSHGNSPAPSGGGGPYSPGNIVVNPNNDDGSTYYDILSPSQNGEYLLGLPIDNASSTSSQIFSRSPSQVQPATPRQPFIQQQYQPAIQRASVQPDQVGQNVGVLQHLPAVQPRQVGQNIGVLQHLPAVQPRQVGQNVGVLQQHLHQPAVIGAQQIPVINIQIVENSLLPLDVIDPPYCLTDGAEAEGSRLKRFLTSGSETISIWKDYDHLSQYHCKKRSYFGSLAEVHWSKNVIGAPVDVTNLHPHLQHTMGIGMPISHINQDMLNAGSIRLQVEGNQPIVYKPTRCRLQRIWLPIYQPRTVNLVCTIPSNLIYSEPVAGHTC